MSPMLRVSPCSHGIEHHVVDIPEGSEFWVPECKDGRGRPRYHKATREHYKTPDK